MNTIQESRSRNEADNQRSSFANWIFVTTYFASTFILGPSATPGIPHVFILSTRNIELIAFFSLGFYELVLLRSTPAWKQRKIFTIAFTFCLVALIWYFINKNLFNGTFPYGTPTKYFQAYLLWIATYIGFAIYAVLWFSLDKVLEIFWIVSRLSIFLALGAYLYSDFSSHPLLTFPNYVGGYRLQGLLAEPSAWAPVIAVVVILSLTKRSYSTLVIALVAGVLTGSGAVLAVTTISVPLVFLIRRGEATWRFLMLVFLILVSILPFWFLESANSNALLNSSNIVIQGVGKVSSALQSYTSSGNVSNARTVSAEYTFSDIEQAGKEVLGFGPGAVSAYFRARYASNNTSQASVDPNSLALEFLFDFGVCGLIFFVTASVHSLFKLRKISDAVTLFTPFFIASFINSADGPDLYKWFFVALFLTSGSYLTTLGHVDGNYTYPILIQE